MKYLLLIIVAFCFIGCESLEQYHKASDKDSENITCLLRQGRFSYYKHTNEVIVLEGGISVAISMKEIPMCFYIEGGNGYIYDGEAFEVIDSVLKVYPYPIPQKETQPHITYKKQIPDCK